MNPNYRILGAIALLVGTAALNAGAYENSGVALKAARQKLQSADYAAAQKAADEAIQLAGDNLGEKIDAILFKAQVAQSLKDFEGAKAECAKVLAESKATIPQKIAAINRQAAVLLAEKKPDEARAVYLKAIEMPGLPADTEKPRLLISLGKTYDIEKDYVKAAEIYNKVAAEAGVPVYFKIQAVKSIALGQIDRGKYDDARTEYARLLALPDLKPVDRFAALLDIGASFEKQKEFARAREEFSKAAAVEEIDARTKANALTRVAKTFASEGDLPSLKRSMASLAEVAEKPDFALLRSYALLAAQQGNSAEEEEGWSRILALPDITPAQYGEAVFKKIDCLAIARKPEEVQKLASEAAVNAALSGEQKLTLSLLAAGLPAGKGKPLDLKAIPKSALEPQEQAKAYGEAAKVLMRMRDYEAARAFGAKAQSMFREAPSYVYECKFMEKAPLGVSGWEDSSIVKDPARRESRFEEYNKAAAALLINDVNVVRSVPSPSGGDGKQANIGFYMAADARGWHIYIHSKQDQVDQVLAGLLSGGDLEMYFAPGAGECYYQFTLALPSGKAGFVSWMSPNRHYRKLDSYFASEVAPLDDGFGVSLFLPWELVYDKLPKEGELWPFGVINFSRAGGFTWGSGQVHELHKFGKVRFSGIEKSMPAIRRAIVMKAFANYKKASLDAKRFWNDAVRGDRQFYETVLLPRIEKFDELGKSVTPQISEKEVDTLFAKTVPDWMEFNYLVSELRTQYLAESLFSQK